MKYTVTIGSRIFENVSNQKISSSWRSESRSKNLGGELLIDRIGNEKAELKIVAGGLKAEDLVFLRNERKKMTTVVKYYSGNTLVTKTMYMNPFDEPAPIYFYGDKTKGMIYPNITLSFSEV